MSTPPRMSADARRQTILQAVTQVFAEKGFKGTKTRDLAKAANVSEALLYKHFPSKESLYAAMREECAKRNEDHEAFEKIAAQPPSTACLVAWVRQLISVLVHSCRGEDVKHRLFTRSLFEDADFVRPFLQKIALEWGGYFQACLQAARQAGDAHDVPVRPDLGAWFVHHVGVGLMLHVAAIDYGADSATLIEQATWFALLGCGVTGAAIQSFYPKESNP